MTSDDEPVADGPAPGGEPAPDSEVPPASGGDAPSAPEQNPAPAPNSPPNSPPSGGQAPPPVDGPPSSGRKLNVKKVIAVLAVIGVVIAGIGVFALGGLSLPSIGECDPGNPNATVVSHQSSGPDGERVALQLTNTTDLDYVHIMSGGESVANMTGSGNTTTVTALSSGHTIEYVGFHKCGNETVGSYTVN